MANPTNGKQVKNPTPSRRKLKRTLILTGVSALIVLLVLYSMLRQDPARNNNDAATIATTDTPSGKTPEIGQLVGRWVRPDGGYILEIRSASTEGKLDVGYYNPNSINVGRAEWVHKDGKLFVLTELQDVNYPGSTYGLEYKVAQDKLVGSYYQAQEQQTFEVEFEREK